MVSERKQTCAAAGGSHKWQGGTRRREASRQPLQGQDHCSSGRRRRPTAQHTRRRSSSSGRRNHPAAPHPAAPRTHCGWSRSSGTRPLQTAAPAAPPLAPAPCPRGPEEKATKAKTQLWWAQHTWVGRARRQAHKASSLWPVQRGPQNRACLEDVEDGQHRNELVLVAAKKTAGGGSAGGGVWQRQRQRRRAAPAQRPSCRGGRRVRAPDCDRSRRGARRRRGSRAGPPATRAAPLGAHSVLLPSMSAAPNMRSKAASSR